MKCSALLWPRYGTGDQGPAVRCPCGGTWRRRGRRSRTLRRVGSSPTRSDGKVALDRDSQCDFSYGTVRNGARRRPEAVNVTRP